MSQSVTIANTNPERAALFFGRADESWCEALERFQRFVSEAVDEWRDEDAEETHVVRLLDSYAPEDLWLQHGPLSAHAVLELERVHHVRLPAGLVSLLTGQGGFTLWPSGRIPSFQFFDNVDPAYPSVRNLRQAMAFQGLQHFLAHELSSDVVADIEKNFFCFGVASFADADMAFLVFDREGRFLIYDFVDERVEYSVQGIEALQRGTADGSTLDDVLRRCVNWSIYQLLAAAEVPVDEYRDWRDRWRELFPVGNGVEAERVWRMRIPTVD